MKVVFWGIRHGDKEAKGADPGMTPMGSRQVAKRALQHLVGIDFKRAYWTGLIRTKQTAREVLKAIGFTGLFPFIEEEPMFGFKWANDALPEFPIGEAQKLVDAAKAAGAPETVGLWKQHWPTCRVIAAGLRGTMRTRALFLSREFKGESEVHALIADHSPTIELLMPDDCPRLPEAGIVRYTWEVDNDDPCLANTHLVSAEVIAADPVVLSD